MGIAKESLVYIFDPFTRFHEFEGDRERAGIGLGLHVVKTMVEMMKGEVAASSDVGVGSEFVVTIDLDIATN